MRSALDSLTPNRFHPRSEPVARQQVLHTSSHARPERGYNRRTVGRVQAHRGIHDHLAAWGVSTRCSG